ncbi:MAG: CorA family divalent cation transporter [Lachnospiraceae bacterium]
MNIYALGEALEELDETQTDQMSSVLVLTDTARASEAMELAGITYEGEISLAEVGFCKIETGQECMAGSLFIPRMVRSREAYHKILFFINSRNIVIVDDYDYAKRIIMRIKCRKTKQKMTKEQLMYQFLGQIIGKDLEMLGQYERQLMNLEEKVMAGKTDAFQNEIMPIRKELLILNGYYDQIMDMGKEMEENENRFFAKKQLKYFGIIADRADRLMGKTNHLLAYAQQIRDAYQSQMDKVQNRNMQFLTVISTIFYPLTLITGWYGMNFRNMPELEKGYPGVIALSVIVVGVCIIIFKKKKIL